MVKIHFKDSERSCFVSWKNLTFTWSKVQLKFKERIEYKKKKKNSSYCWQLPTLELEEAGRTEVQSLWRMNMEFSRCQGQENKVIIPKLSIITLHLLVYENGFHLSCIPHWLLYLSMPNRISNLRSLYVMLIQTFILLT